MKRAVACGAWVLMAMRLQTCLPEPAAGDLPQPAPVLATAPRPSAVVLAALGRKMFFDRNLSASHRMSCATCHDPRFAYGPPNSRPVQLGGSRLRAEGHRAVPSLRYLQKVPRFTDHGFDESVDESVDNGPTGGFTWDGRVSSPHEQARIPLLSPLEMANRDEEQVVAAVAASDYAQEFRRAFGDRVFNDPAAGWGAVTGALEAFLDDPAEFFPYTSKYDAFLRQRATLSDSERRGLALFNDPAKGNCAHCHPSTVGAGGGLPSFTDFGYAVLGVPRNRAIAANRNRWYYDLGLCGPLRTDLRDRAGFCGMFRAPSLRNVGLRRTFFHNGVFGSLEQVLRFYAERDVHPQKWYRTSHPGQAPHYDDLPETYWQNVNREPPFDRGPGDPPALTEAEIGDVIAFLQTLTDGWSEAGEAARSTASPVAINGR